MIQLCLSWLINEGTEREQRGNREEAMKKKPDYLIQFITKEINEISEISEKTMRTMKNEGNNEKTTKKQ